MQDIVNSIFMGTFFDPLRELTMEENNKPKIKRPIKVQTAPWLGASKPTQLVGATRVTVIHFVSEVFFFAAQPGRFLYLFWRPKVSAKFLPPLYSLFQFSWFQLGFRGLGHVRAFRWRFQGFASKEHSPTISRLLRRVVFLMLGFLL
jgi:hypothetical protein